MSEINDDSDGDSIEEQEKKAESDQPHEPVDYLTIGMSPIKFWRKCIN